MWDVVLVWAVVSALARHIVDPKKSSFCNSSRIQQCHRHLLDLWRQQVAMGKNNLKSTRNQFANSKSHKPRPGKGMAGKALAGRVGV